MSVPFIWFPVFDGFFLFLEFGKTPKPVRSNFCKYISIFGLNFAQHSKFLVLGDFCISKRVFCVLKNQKNHYALSNYDDQSTSPEWSSLNIDR